ncbi:hypothetical protein PFICI_14883 [Pestalotiopsis fici W106-1]|uniref:C2H2-type domain-containing protein n=1 Tax=Pestalotiopsis fici (strain W106-1 / CGMCC3.15140) TaxID=1229662 RepID=W3WHC4_PESFW|nr:uncharacterized protein PFICI_14883 [Pestalotiopsis fici W106-1]ETS73278.1 hypothetical protein PFICI_14883 [Pestalotiopsis fici W106-1]
MEHFNVDMSLEYDEDEFNSFGSQLSSASSARSFSTAPSCVPITPQSGRSSPQQHTASMSFTSISDYNFTPPGSSMDGYFPSNVKSEFRPRDMEPSTPSKKSTVSPYNMNFEQSAFLNSTLPCYEHMMDFQPPGLEYSFSDQMPTSPFDHRPPPYSTHHSGPDNGALWLCPSQSSFAYSEKLSSPQSTTLCLKSLSLQEGSSAPSPYVSSNLRRQVAIDDVQQKSSLLHRVQNGGRVGKKGKRTGTMGSQITTVPPSKFKCEYPECANEKAYKRAEHLKRHWTTKHNPDVELHHCPFCDRSFNRSDNFTPHLFLHVDPVQSGPKRTKYHPDAKRVYEAEMLRKKRRDGGKKQSV